MNVYYDRTENKLKAIFIVLYINFTLHFQRLTETYDARPVSHM